jgi:rSAM/selenodomain-associated transferase 2/rSAM/selenodomain-associated transferase 1
MTRYPQAGRVKTRLAAEMGDEKAAQLHSDIARHCIRRMHAVALSGDVDLEVRVAGASPSKTRAWLGRRVRVREQCGANLGERLASALQIAVDEGAPSAIAVGSDAPEVGGRQIREAIAALESVDVVLGPAADGGYYLIGVAASAAARAIPALLAGDIPWGTQDVLTSTLTAAESAGISVGLLAELADVDRPEDLALWDAILAEEERARTDPTLSVVIATLNEAENIQASVESALDAGAHEVIVADGGSTDTTVELAERCGVTVVDAPQGRAAQINVGAEHATGDVLLLLHADSLAPETALRDTRDVLADPDVALGGFRFSAGNPSRRSDRLMSWVGRTRHGLFGLPYGDQGQFLRRIDFEDLGRMPEMPVMEDYEFALRCRKLGRLGVARSRLWTSARGWEEHGIVKVAVVNSAVIVGYRAGVDPNRLAAWRGSIAEREG